MLLDKKVKCVGLFRIVFFLFLHISFLKSFSCTLIFVSLKYFSFKDACVNHEYSKMLEIYKMIITFESQIRKIVLYAIDLWIYKWKIWKSLSIKFEFIFVIDLTPDNDVIFWWIYLQHFRRSKMHRLSSLLGYRTAKTLDRWHID